MPTSPPSKASPAFSPPPASTRARCATSPSMATPTPPTSASLTSATHCRCTPTSTPKSTPPMATPGWNQYVAPELLARQALTDEAIVALVAERTQAKRQRNFARADQIRNELAEKGVIIEDSKDGVRWKRK